MPYLILGLLLFLGVHSIRIFADDWRMRTMVRIGPNAWRAVYSLISLAGFALLLWGYGQARQDTTMLWTPPLALRHLTALLMLVAMVLLVATYVPNNPIKARLQHPMVLSVKTWAFAHLLANGSLADVVLFGSFLVWAVLCFRSARGRGPIALSGTP
ncbi:MAG: NnrU family protein, partial [Paucibacter sp.]|nr:NnrU family protein [Roseateles sp.]